jgi:hypothetical protein
MTLTEYESIKHLTYLEYCDYLQSKYGIGLSDYMTKSYNKNKKVTRTSEGLFAHHKYEDHAIMLSTKEYAMGNPFDWQLAKNIVYCNYLEHLFLHILICEYPAPDKNPLELVGVGGIENFLVPELNDLYSGWEPNQPWKQRCFDQVRNDKDTYFALLKRYKLNSPRYVIDDFLLRSFNEHYGLWSKHKNQKIFEEIKAILECP